MNHENFNIHELEARLRGMIDAQAELLQSFMESTIARLDRHKERLDSHLERIHSLRDDIGQFEAMVKELENTKQDILDEHAERARIAEKENEKLVAEQLAEEKERQASRAISDILDRIEDLEEGVPYSNYGEGLIDQLSLIQEKVEALEKAIQGRDK